MESSETLIQLLLYDYLSVLNLRSYITSQLVHAPNWGQILDPERFQADTLHNMDWLEYAPLIITALLGTTGIVTALSKFAEFSEPNRLRKRLATTAAAAAAFTPSSGAREKLELACERDAARLAAISLIQTQPHEANRLRNIVFALLLVVTGGLAIGGCFYLFSPPSEIVDAEFRERYSNFFKAGLFGIILAAVCVMLFSIFGYYSDSQSRRITRESLATSMFVSQVSISDIKAHIQLVQVADFMLSGEYKRAAKVDRKDAKRRRKQYMAEPVPISVPGPHSPETRPGN